MMVFIADTPPINYLIVINEIEPGVPATGSGRRRAGLGPDRPKAGPLDRRDAYTADGCQARARVRSKLVPRICSMARSV